MMPEEFDNILEECLERVLAGEPVKQCLQRYAGQAAELEPLLKTALDARDAAAITPRPEFREIARRDFQAALRESRVAPGHRLSGWRPRWVATVAASLVVLLAGSTVLAAGGSMPDGTLYPVKLAAEDVQIALTPSALGKAELYAKLADRRVAEIAAMAEKGEPEKVEQAAGRLNVHLAEVAALASSSKQVAMLQTLMPDAAPAPAPTPAPVPAPAPPKAPPAEVAPAPSIAAAPPPVIQVPEPAVVDKTAGDGKADKADKREKLKEALAERAAENREVLEEALSRAPESARPALQRAIEKSQEGYRKALEALD